MKRATKTTTREKMILSAVEVMRERGASGVTIDAVLGRSGAPRGSVYHHFPEGRDQIVSEALTFSGDAITAVINDSAPGGSSALLQRFVDFWKEILLAANYRAGCPVVAVAVTSTPENSGLIEETAEIFSRWKAALAAAFREEGLGTTQSEALSTMAVASVEGAIILCRSERSIEPLELVMSQLELLIASQREA